MRKLILTWIMVAFATGACAMQYNVQKAPPTAFEKICAKVETAFATQCGDLAEPTVVYTRIIESVGYGVIGVHINGEPYIFVHPRDDANEEIKTHWIVYHEMVHYVLYELGLRDNRCQSEDVAREWTSTEFDFPVDPNWKTNYGCDSLSVIFRTMGI